MQSPIFGNAKAENARDVCDDNRKQGVGVNEGKQGVLQRGKKTRGCSRAGVLALPPSPLSLSCSLGMTEMCWLMHQQSGWNGPKETGWRQTV